MTGSGTLNDPYIISDVDDLQAIENDLAAYYELGGDIDASATSGWNGGLGFAPIGTSPIPFTGSFDGKGYTISDLFVNRPLETTNGLFGATKNCGEIKNVGLLNCDITGMSWIGSLIGRQLSGCALVSNCYATGSVTVDHDDDPQSDISYIGGLIGESLSDISGCYSACSVYGALTSTRSLAKIGHIGGLVGEQYGSGTTITDCYATGNITVVGSKAAWYVGGLVGFTWGIIEKSYATGNVSVTTEDNWTSYIGGFTGICSGGSISDCYARGSVTVVAGSTSRGEIGGFLGGGGYNDNCYSTGSISVTVGLPYVGGFAGLGGAISNCFWDTQTSGYETSSGGTGKTTAEMKTASTFTDAGWDFATIWNICSGINNDYPFLAVAIPTVTTNPAADLAAISATLNGTLDDDGGEACECGFEWGKDVPYGNTTPSESKTAGQTFSQPITGLQPKTTYRFKAFATNSKGQAYGTVLTLSTPASLPVITTNPATGTSTLNATLGDDGGEACECGFEWGETEAYGNTTPTQSRRTGQSVLQTIGELLPDTTYHFRAFATNSRGTDYGADRSFTTPAALPTVATNPATELGAIAATLNGTLGDDGGEVCECGFEFGLGTGYGTITPTESKITDEDFSQVIGGLIPNTAYHFRAFATNSSGTGYGADRTFTTTLIISRAYALAREEL